MVFPVEQAIAEEIVESLDLPYPLYADPGYELFTDLQTRFSAGLPLPAWVVVDVDGTIRFLWRATEGGLMDHYPEGDEIVDVVRGLTQ